MEEVVRSLRETGAVEPSDGRLVLVAPVDQIHVPDTIQDVIAARIDRLADEPKRALQVASVIGREFTRRLLGRLSEIRGEPDAVLRELAAIELIREKALFPELAYMFTHALTHDVAYASLLVQRRRELHRLIGLAIEELYAERIAEHYEVLAHHFSRAEAWDKALALPPEGGGEDGRALSASARRSPSTRRRSPSPGGWASRFRSRR